MPVNFKTIAEIMEELNLKSIIRAKKYKSFKGDVGKAAENILQQNFKATEPHKKWATNVIEFNVKLCLKKETVWIML
ncbi:hypothetical protein [Myroides phaeus]